MCVHIKIHRTQCLVLGTNREFWHFSPKGISKNVWPCSPAGFSLYGRWFVRDVCEQWGCCTELRCTVILGHQWVLQQIITVWLRFKGLLVRSICLPFFFTWFSQIRIFLLFLLTIIILLFLLIIISLIIIIISFFLLPHSTEWEIS